MEIRLSVDSHQLSGEVEALVKNLSMEQKQDLAKQLLAQVFVDMDNSLDKVYIENKVLEKYRIKENNPNSTLEQAKKSWRWDEILKAEQSIKRDLVNSVISEVVNAAKEQIKEKIQENTKIQQVINETILLIQADFPKYVQNAMTMFLTTQMQQAMSQASASLMVSENTNHLANDLNNRLLNKGI